MSGRYTLIYLLSIILLLSISSKAQWTKVNTSGLPTPWGLGYAIDAADSNNVVISITGGLYKSADGGITWKSILKLTNSDFTDVSMPDKNNIWGAAMNGEIYYSQDGGTTWKVQYKDTSKTQFMNYIEMFDLQNGIAMGDNVKSDGPAVFLSTTDGGNHWVSVNNESFGNASGDFWRRLDFPNKNTGYFLESGMNPQYIYKTTNGGLNWTKLEPSTSVMVIKFYDDKIGLYCGGSDVRTPSLYRTVNGGLKWEQSAVSIPNWGNDIEFIPKDPSMIWFSDARKVYFSSDTGRTFKEYALPPGGQTIQTRDIVFPDKGQGWLLCDNGLLFKTATLWYKTTGIENEIKTPQGYALLQNYPNPFNPATTISYAIPAAGNVRLTVYDILGNEIETLVNEFKAAGSYSLQLNASSLPSGIYFYRLQCGSYSVSKKMTVMK